GGAGEAPPAGPSGLIPAGCSEEICGLEATTEGPVPNSGVRLQLRPDPPVFRIVSARLAVWPGVPGTSVSRKSPGLTSMSGGATPIPLSATVTRGWPGSLLASFSVAELEPPRPG